MGTCYPVVMSRYCEICRGHDDTGLGICSDCAELQDEKEQKEN